MRGNRAKDTKPEVALRSELHCRGLRFRKHPAVVPGLRCAPDVVFPRARIVVECRGCFWHCCPEHAVLPKSNLDYWLPKLNRNVQRDARNEAALREAGWTLIVVWEHDDLGAAADVIEAAVRTAASGRPQGDRPRSAAPRTRSLLADGHEQDTDRPNEFDRSDTRP